jgi:hypothetical protein
VTVSARTLVFLAVFCAMEGASQAQLLNCGTITTKHDMRQTPNYKRSVDVTASTSRSANLCLIELQTEVWVDALSTYVTIKRDLYSATATQTRGVPTYGVWSSSANHWAIWTGSSVWTNLGRTYAKTTVEQPPSSGGMCEITALDCPPGYVYEAGLCDCKTTSPILIDTAGDGYRLTSGADGVEFDMDADGQPIERVAWTEPQSDDAWLVLDRNGNGVIDSGEELFGNQTPAFAGSSEPRAANGFDALLMTEGPSYGGGSADRVIDARDAVFSRLQLWFDRNHNGRTDRGERVSLPDAGIISVSTQYKEIGKRDQYGNLYKLAGKATFRTPDGQVVERQIYDVYLTVWQPGADGKPRASAR